MQIYLKYPRIYFMFNKKKRFLNKIPNKFLKKLNLFPIDIDLALEFLELHLQFRQNIDCFLVSFLETRFIFVDFRVEFLLQLINLLLNLPILPCGFRRVANFVEFGLQFIDFC